MNVSRINNLTFNWLKKKLDNHENGIIFEDTNMVAFDAIQNFIESVDYASKTPVIYFEAFPEESSAKFFATLYYELVSKHIELKNDEEQSLVEVIKAASLKMIIIDKIHLQPIDTLNSMIDFFNCCDVTMILISTKKKTQISGLIDHPHIAKWGKLSIMEASFIPKSF